MNLKRGLFSLILIINLVLATQIIFSDIIINEIMYNPIENEYYNEWIEIYNNGTEELNISNYTICNSKILSGYIDKNNTIFRSNNFIINPDSYAIITDGVSGTEVYDYNNVSNETLSFHVDSSSICGGLSNSGDIIILNDEINNLTIVYDDIAAEGYSIELVNGEYIQSNELKGTIGVKNNATKNNNSNEDTTDYSFATEINISKSNYSLNEPLNITGYISVNGTDKNVSITIKIARKINSTYNYKWYILEEKAFLLSNLTNISDIIENLVNYTIPDDFIKGEYKILLSLKYESNNSYRYKYADAYFYVNGLDDLGEYNLEIIDYPSNIGFGDIDTVFVKVDSNNYKLKNVSLVAYVYSPKWASIDLNDETLMTRPYNSNIALKINEIKRGTTNYFSIPILTKRNCENDYTNGVYNIKVRLYENSEDLLEENFNLSISGINDAMCPKTIIETKTSSAKCSESIKSLNKETDEKDDTIFTYDKIKFDINFDKEIEDKFNTNIDIINSNESKKIIIQTYIVSTRTKISEVVEEQFELKEYETRKINMTGKILRYDLQNNTKLIVKINSSNRKTEKSINYPISLKQKENLKKIVNFYITKKNSSLNEIYVDVELNCEKGDIVVFDSFFESKNLSCKKNLRFNSKLNNENNVFFLNLIKDDKIIDSKRIVLNNNNENYMNFKSDNIDNYKNNNVDDMINKVSNKNLVTGNVVNSKVLYESTNEKLKKIIKYLILISITISIIIFLKNKYEKREIILIR